MALKFLNKKGWHTGSLRNIENVWKAEQKHEAEQRKLEELKKQIKEEREKQEFRQLQEQAGLVPKQERLEFLYDSGLAVGKVSSSTTEDYLLGKPVEEAKPESEVAKVAAAPGSLFVEDKTPQSANDQWRKLHSDPLLLIRQQEQAALARIKNNPVKMEMIKKSVEANMPKKEKKRKHKDKKHKEKKKKKSRSDSEEEMTKTRMSGRRVQDQDDSFSEGEPQRGQRSSKEDDFKGSNLRRRADSPARGSSPRRRHDIPVRRHDRSPGRQYVNSSKHDSPRRDCNSSRRGSVSPSRRRHDSPDSSPTHGKHEIRRRQNENQRRVRGISPGSSPILEESRRRHDSPRGQQYSPRRQQYSPRRRHGSPRRQADSPRRHRDSPMRRHESARRQDDSPRKPVDSPRRLHGSPRRQDDIPRRRNDSPRRRHESPRMQDDSPRKPVDSPRRLHGSPRRQDDLPRRRNVSPRRHHESPRRQDDSPRKPVDSPRRQNDLPRRRHDSPDDVDGPKASHSDKANLSRGEPCHKGPHNSNNDWKRNKAKHQAGKLSEEEKAARLREMQMDAEVHEEQRWHRLKKASDADKLEEAKSLLSNGKNNFLDATARNVYGAVGGGSVTVEESVRRRTHFISRTIGDSNVNTFKRS